VSLEDLQVELRRVLSPSARLEVAAPLGARTTYRVGGPAALLLEVAEVGDLAALAQQLAGHTVELLVLGNGSNLLVADAGFEGIVVHLGGGFNGIAVAGTEVVAGARADLPRVARRSVDASLTGFEWAVGVPGTIGGAVQMNAGGHGAALAESLVEVDLVDLSAGTGAVETLPASSLDLSYRHSNLTGAQVVVGARLGLAPGDRQHSQELLRDIVAWRRANQPGGQNAGSVFQNPPGTSAGALIEAAGCKGLRLRSAQVSTKHANFIQADPAGRADDVAGLISLVRARVLEHSGIELHTELRLIGQFAERVDG